VFEVLGEQLLGKPLLIQNAEVLTVLGNKQKPGSENRHDSSTVLLRSQDHKSTEMGKGKTLSDGNCLCERFWVLGTVLKSFESKKTVTCNTSTGRGIFSFF